MAQPHLKLVSEQRFTLATADGDPLADFETLDAMAARLDALAEGARLYVVGVDLARGDDVLVGSFLAVRFEGRPVTPPVVEGLTPPERPVDQLLAFALVRPVTSDAAARLSNALDNARSNRRAAAAVERARPQGARP